jgi:hypothetical protein
LEDSCEGCKKLCEGENPTKAKNKKKYYGKESTKGEKEKKKKVIETCSLTCKANQILRQKLERRRRACQVSILLTTNL